MKSILIGAGFMAKEYMKVLIDLKIETKVYCVSESSAEKFKEEFHVNAFAGGALQITSNDLKDTDFAIVASSIRSLKEITIHLINNGCKKILLEKPGAFTERDLSEINDLATRSGANVRVAYNRRFYPTLRKALEIAESDGGIRSFHFELSEWSRSLEGWKKDPLERQFIGLTNTTHIIDMAFFSGGLPKTISPYISRENEISWHPNGTIFTGAGVSENEIPFTYKSDWNGAGSWGLELETFERKLLLCPLEKLFQRKKGTFIYEQIELESNNRFKYGVKEMLQHFIDEDGVQLPDLHCQRSLFKIAGKMLNYSSEITG